VTLLTSLLFVNAIILIVFLIHAGFIAVGYRPATLAVTFRLTDYENQPLANVPVRLLFRCDKNWQEPDSGYHFVTDEDGYGWLTVPVVFDRRWRKMPNGFFNTLLTIPMLTDHISVGAEIQYANSHWVYTAEIVLFPEGTTMQDDYSFYAPDEEGRYTVKASYSKYDWKIREGGRLILTYPGYEPCWRVLSRGETGKDWSLNLGYKRVRDPVQH
jgi:hypothetical protein